MPAGLCIPKSIVDKVKTAIKSGDINLDKFYEMSSADRATVLSHYVGEDSAHLVNAVYEKAKIVAEKKAAADYVTASDKGTFAQTATKGEFAKKLLTDEQTKKLAAAKLDQGIKNNQARQRAVSEALSKAEGEDKANLQLKLDKLKDQEARLNVRKEDTLNPVHDRMLAKINSVKGLLGDEDYQDIVAAKMGQDISPAQGKYIVDQATKLQELAKGNKDSIIGVTPEYLAARSNLDTFINNLNPDHPGMSIIKNLIEIQRNNLITSIKTPLKTAFSALVNNPAGMVVRRLASRSMGDNAAFAKEVKGEIMKTFWKTGSNVSAMADLNDASSVLGSHAGTSKTFESVTGNEKFDAPTTAGGGKALGGVAKVTSKVAQFSHYVAIHLEHNIVFAKTYSSAFADALNFKASIMAKVEGLKGADVQPRALELMKDAAKVEPTTEAGKILRNSAQASAAKVLSVGNTWASRFSVGTKNLLNSIHPDVPIGTLLEPIAKIPANLIAYGIKTTPLGFPEVGVDLWKGRSKMNSGVLETQYEGALQYKTGVEKLIGIVGSIAIASLITSQLTKKDFRTDTYGSHYMKFGNIWINTEYFSRLSPNIAGMMAVKMDTSNDGFAGKIKAFLTGNKVGEGALGSLLNVPGVDVINQAAQSVLGKHAVQDLIGNTESRIFPALWGDVTGTHPLFRTFTGAHGIETTQMVHEDDVAKAKKAAARRAANKK